MLLKILSFLASHTGIVIVVALICSARFVKLINLMRIENGGKKMRWYISLIVRAVIIAVSLFIDILDAIGAFFAMFSFIVLCVLQFCACREPKQFKAVTWLSVPMAVCFSFSFAALKDLKQAYLGGFGTFTELILAFVIPVALVALSGLIHWIILGKPVDKVKKLKKRFSHEDNEEDEYEDEDFDEADDSDDSDDPDDGSEDDSEENSDEDISEETDEEPDDELDDSDESEEEPDDDSEEPDDESEDSDETDDSDEEDGFTDIERARIEECLEYGFTLESAILFVRGEITAEEVEFVDDKKKKKSSHIITGVVIAVAVIAVAIIIFI